MTLTFRDVMIKQNDAHRHIGETVCTSDGHDVERFIDKYTGEPMQDYGYCKRCLGVLSRAKPQRPKDGDLAISHGDLMAAIRSGILDTPK